MQKDFFSSLFDISFRSLITTRIVKVIYVIYMVAVGLAALAFIVSSFASSIAVGILVLLIAAPIFSLIYLIVGRVWLEVVIVLFRIMENTQELVEQGRLLAPATAGAAPSAPPGPSVPPTSPSPPASDLAPPTEPLPPAEPPPPVDPPPQDV